MKVFPHIMVPLVGIEIELDQQAAVIKKAAERVQMEQGEYAHRPRKSGGAIKR